MNRNPVRNPALKFTYRCVSFPRPPAYLNCTHATSYQKVLSCYQDVSFVQAQISPALYTLWLVYQAAIRLFNALNTLLHLYHDLYSHCVFLEIKTKASLLVSQSFLYTNITKPTNFNSRLVALWILIGRKGVTANRRLLLITVLIFIMLSFLTVHL